MCDAGVVGVDLDQVLLDFAVVMVTKLQHQGGDEKGEEEEEG